MSYPTQAEFEAALNAKGFARQIRSVPTRRYDPENPRCFCDSPAVVVYVIEGKDAPMCDVLASRYQTPTTFCGYLLKVEDHVKHLLRYVAPGEPRDSAEEMPLGAPRG